MSTLGHASDLVQTLQGRRLRSGPDGSILTPLDAVDAIEAAMAMGEEEHGERWRKRPVLHHVKKGLGHALSAGPRGDGIDDDSGHPHLVLAATRMVLAVAVYLASREA